jgi:hypothetical protein
MKMKKYLFAFLLMVFAASACYGAPWGGGGSMIYPGAGIPISTGSAWGTSIGVGTLTNTYICTYTTASGVVCNTNPATYQAAGSYLTAASTLDATKLSGNLPAISGALLTSLPTQVSDTAYDATTWDAVTTIAPSKNAVRDYLESFISVGTDGTRGIGITNNTSAFSTTTGNWFTSIANAPYFTVGATQYLLLYSGGALGTPSSGTLTNCTFPTLNQDTTGLTAANVPAPTTTVSSGAISVTTKNTYVICTAACQVTIPVAAAGIQVCVRNAPGTTGAITLVNRANQYYELTTHAAWATVNQKLVSGGVATDSICVVGYDATHYATMSYTGTWTDTAP